MGQDVEVILLKQLASCLRIPIALIAPDGALLYFNEPAEEVFGLRFEEVGTMDARALPCASSSRATRVHVPLKREERPLMPALDRRVPTHAA